MNINNPSAILGFEELKNKIQECPPTDFAEYGMNVKVEDIVNYIDKVIANLRKIKNCSLDNFTLSYLNRECEGFVGKQALVEWRPNSGLYNSLVMFNNLLVLELIKKRSAKHEMILIFSAVVFLISAYFLHVS